MAATQFLQNREYRPLHLIDTRGLRPVGLVLGNGPNALEVALAECDRRPSAPDLRAIWRARLAGRATPLLLVVLYPGSAAGTAASPREIVALCGPSGDQPPVLHDLGPAQIERLCDRQQEPERGMAIRLIESGVT